MRREDDQTYRLRLTVRNQPGVLVRCAMVFGRRGHTIEALQCTPVADSESATHMDITAYGQPGVIRQIMAQLRKSVDILDVVEREA